MSARNLSNLLTMAQAARLLGVTRQTIWGAIKKGRIKVAAKVGHVPLVSRSSLTAYRRSPGKPGRPRKKRVRNDSEYDVARLRSRLGLSQKKFAEKLGVSVSSVVKWETGWRKPGGLSLRALERLRKLSRRRVTKR